MVKRSKCLLILLGIFLFHLAVNYHVMTGSHVTHAYDEFVRVWTVSEVFKICKSPGIDIGQCMGYFIRLDNGQGHPRLFEITETLVWSIINPLDEAGVERVIWVTNSIFLLILLLSVYGIGARLYDPGVGLLAAFMTSMLPGVFGHARIAMLDYPLMCMVSASLYLLLRTEGFSRFRYSILFGAVFGLAELTKESAVVFIVPTLVYYCIRSGLSGDRKVVAVNCLGAISAFVMVAGIVYLRPDNFKVFGTYIAKMGLRSGLGEFYYVQEFGILSGFAVAVFSLAFLIRHIVNLIKREWFLFCWFASSLLLFSLSSNKTVRFILPVLPAFSLIVAGELVRAPGGRGFQALVDWVAGRLIPLFAGRSKGRASNQCSAQSDNGARNWRKVMIGGLVALLTVQYVAYNLGYIPTKKGYVIEEGRFAVEQDPYLPTVRALTATFQREDRPVGDRLLLIMSLFNNGNITDTLSLQLSIANLPFIVECPGVIDEVDLPKSGWLGSREEILQSNYILYAVNTVVKDPPPYENEVGKVLREFFSEYKDRFVKITEVPVYDGSRIEIYKRTENK